MNAIQQARLLENVAAISGEFFAKTSHFDKFRDAVNTADGMAGVYTFCAGAGLAFTKAEESYDPDYEDCDWYDSIDAFVDWLYKNVVTWKDMPTTPQMVMQANLIRRTKKQGD